MATGATTDGFLDLVRKSGGVDVRRLEAFLGQNASTLPDDPAGVAEALIQAGLLTKFQADPLLRGQPRRFIISGKYRLLDRLGAGGMASVFLCEHRIMRRRVALKVLPANQSSNPAALERFHREARASASLDHPNIVRAHDVDADGKMHFLVVEYVEGSSFYDIVRRHGPMTIPTSCNYIYQASLGLHHAHEKGLVHRDIKPANLLLDRTGTVKILDLGLALFFHDDDNLTKEHDSDAILGTADYLAPEQAINSHNVDIRADIYSLGITLYFLLTGQTPYGQGTTAQKLVWHHLRPPTPIREHRPEVPPELDAVIMKMLAKKPEDRYQTPGEVANALVPWASQSVPLPPEEWMPKPLVPLPTDSPMSEITPVTSITALPTPLEFTGNRGDRPTPTPRPASRPGSQPKSSTILGGRSGPSKTSPGSSERPTPSPASAMTSVTKKKPASDVVEAEVVEAEVADKPGKKKKKKKDGKSNNAVLIGIAAGCALVACLAAAIVTYATYSPPKPRVPVEEVKNTPPPAKKVTPTPPKVVPKVEPKVEPPKKTETPKAEPKKVEPPKAEPKVTPTPPPPPPPPPPAPTLTADFFPTSGRMHYDVAQLNPANNTWVVSRQEWNFIESKDGKELDIANIRLGTLKEPLLAGGKPTWTSSLSKRNPTMLVHADAKTIEFGPRDRRDRTRIATPAFSLQVGTKAGESWKVPGPGGDPRTFTLSKFDKHDGKPSAIVTERTSQGNIETVATHTLVQGVGVVSTSVAQTTADKTTVVQEIKLVTD